MTNLSRVLVTGANGFVGDALCQTLCRKGYSVRAAVRALWNDTDASSGRIEPVIVGSLTGETDWRSSLAGVETVVHLAARAHTTGERGQHALARYRQINVEATERLARTALACGVKRFVFMSSIKVNGERTFATAFTESDMPHPDDAYGISKWEAEQSLARIADESDMQRVVLRAPLVYGPGVKANFLRLMQWIARGTPLPLAMVRNRRSLIYVGNLVDAIVSCIAAPVVANKTYLVSDGEDVSTPDLIRALAAALGVPARLFPFPTPALRLAGALLGKGAEIARLTESLQVDSTPIRSELDWRPPFRLADGLQQTARCYRNSSEMRA